MSNEPSCSDPVFRGPLLFGEGVLQPSIKDMEQPVQRTGLWGGAPGGGGGWFRKDRLGTTRLVPPVHVRVSCRSRPPAGAWATACCLSGWSPALMEWVRIRSTAAGLRCSPWSSGSARRSIPTPLGSLGFRRTETTQCTHNQLHTISICYPMERKASNFNGSSLSFLMRPRVSVHNYFFFGCLFESPQERC